MSGPGLHGDLNPLEVLEKPYNNDELIGKIKRKYKKRMSVNDILEQKISGLIEDKQSLEIQIKDLITQQEIYKTNNIITGEYIKKLTKDNAELNTKISELMVQLDANKIQIITDKLYLDGNKIQLNTLQLQLKLESEENQLQLKSLNDKLIVIESEKLILNNKLLQMEKELYTNQLQLKSLNNQINIAEKNEKDKTKLNNELEIKIVLLNNQLAVVGKEKADLEFFNNITRIKIISLEHDAKLNNELYHTNNELIYQLNQYKTEHMQNELKIKRLTTKCNNEIQKNKRQQKYINELVPHLESI